MFIPWPTRAHSQGDPVFPPLVYHYQDDPETRELGNHKMIGPFLLARACARYDETQTDVYLPSGTWVNYHTGEWIDSTGEWQLNVPLFLEERYTLPLYARAGAVIPEMAVDENTLNIMGLQRDGTVNQDLAVRIFACEGPTQFVLYEDDGWSNAYLNGQMRTTRIEQSLNGDIARVTIFSGNGDYTGSPGHRNNRVTVFFRSRTVTEVLLNNAPLTRYDTLEAFEAAESGLAPGESGHGQRQIRNLPREPGKRFQHCISSGLKRKASIISSTAVQNKPIS